MGDTKVNSCPRCGSESIGYGWSFPPSQGHVDCGDCNAIVVAETEQEAVELWNSGVWHAYADEFDEGGNPVWIYRDT